MPDVYRVNTSSAVSITASTQKTILGYNAPSTCRPKIKRWGASLDAGAANDAAVADRTKRLLFPTRHGPASGTDE